MPKQQKLRFDVHPSVVYQLGESLITDAVQALIELIKNSYDADATYAKVIIDTEGSVKVPGSVNSPCKGRVIVEDDGFGMDLNTIENGWLLISNRTKRKLKEAKKTTPGGRTPLGDKGLGRLGVQRLGKHLEIFTKREREPAYHFGFSWEDFATAPTLQDVDIHLEEMNYHKSHGTKVVVTDLHEIDMWRGQRAIKYLEKELSRMISPYKQIRDFDVLVEVDGKTLELLEVSEKIRALAPIRYRITFDGNVLKVRGTARLAFFRPSSHKDAEEFSLIAESDDGRDFFNFLQEQRLSKMVRLSRSSSKHWFVEFQLEKAIDDMDKVERDATQNGNIANPGPFSGEVDAFDLGATAFKQQSVFDRIREFRRHVKDMSGIRVYRDGFAIRVDHDWLKLGAQWTSASSYYGLKPDNTLGYIALSARENMDLEETTDREGFKDSPFYRNFYALLSEFKEFTTTAHELFGRSWSEFRKKRNEALAHIDSRKTVEDISRTIKTRLAGAKNHKKRLVSFRDRLKTSTLDSRDVVARLASAEEITPFLREKVSEVLLSLEPVLEEARIAVDHVSGYLEEISEVQGMGQVLEDRVDSLRRQMDDMYETVALGLTAEALSHEVFNVADQLARRTKSAQTRLRNKGITDRPVIAFIEYVHSAVMALRKQMSYLSPSLQYVRNQRHVIDLCAFSDELKGFYESRLAKNKITIRVLTTGETPFVIRMNQGKLTQVIDNFILNSEYWLQEDIAQKGKKMGTITLEIDRPFLRIYDDGSGVDPSVEYAIFEPFISAKAKGQGRGLGLFIVKQLLDSEGCSVGLLPERNQRRRMFKFQIDLRGAIDD